MTTALAPISSVTMTSVDWLIEPLVPLGKLTIIAGQMEQGKSQLTALLAAGVTTGRGVNLSAPGSALMFTVEDDDTDTTRPRLEAAGANTDRVFTISDDALDADKIAGYCDALGDVRLVTVDPLTAFFPGSVNPWKTPDVRRFLRLLIELAQKRRFALVGLLHTNRWSDSADPLTRISEAQGIPQVARSVLVLGPDPTDPEGDRRILATAKNNLTKGRPAVSYRIEEVKVSGEISAPRLIDEGESLTTATEVLSGPQSGPADVFLAAALADGPRLAGELYTLADEEGITRQMLRTAKKHLGVTTAKRGLEGWEWTLPTV